MEIPPAGTVAVILAFIIVGLIPKIPVVVRLVVLLVAGLGIYLGMSQAMFDLPNGDNMLIGSLMGGSGGGSIFAFNHLALGFLAPILGLLATGFSALLQKLIGRKQE